MYEGKHILVEGKSAIRELKSKMGIQCSIENIKKKFFFWYLLSSDSNYIESDQPGILNVKKNHKGLSSVVHKQGSYVLVVNQDNSESIKFKSNAAASLVVYIFK